MKKTNVVKRGKKVAEIKTINGQMSNKKRALLLKQQNDRDFPFNVGTGKMTDNPIY